MACPQAWHYLYELNFQLKKTDSLFFGSSIHEAIAAFYEGKLPLVILDEFMRKSSWQKPPTFDVEKNIDEATTLIELFLKKAPYFEPLPGWIEQRKSIYLSHPRTGESIPIPFTFKIDLITKDGYIVDHKTSKSASLKQTDQNRIQGIAYQMAYRTIFNKKPKGFIQNLIIRQKRNPRIIPQVFHYTQDDEIYVFDLLKYCLDKIEKREHLTMMPMMKTFYGCPIGVLCTIHGRG